MAKMAATATLIIVATFLPFLPGPYDGLAVTLSGMAQSFGIAGLILVPIGALWLIYEYRKQKNKEYYFAIASVVALSIIAVVASIGAVASIGFSFAIIALALWAYGVLRTMPRLKLLKNAEVSGFNPMPLYLVFIPIVVFLFQFTLVGSATEFSRNYTIAKSAELIRDIEEYRNANGHYPKSLLAEWHDYEPSVIGIKQYYYEPNGDAYNLFFEQFTYRLGTREFVMYNKLDEHVMIAHDSDILWWTPEELRDRRGWYAVHDTSSPQWKYFWFD